ncbi:MAG: RNA polymerase sigma-70 factor [Runella slithyformis]|nr:MAG: RNA polymerase sigma-70 factor [Runella slithyformis]TAF82176.1 MAG: RNA polymerase sigma-70 factor [Runella slithyformis]
MEYQLLTDDLLTKLLQVGDEGAFREIYKRYWKPLAKTAMSKLRSEADVEEILQEVFMRLWEKRATSKIDSLKAYLFAALKYQIIDHYKAQLLAERYANQALAKQTEPDNAPDREVHFQQIIQIFENVLQQLPEKTRSVFSLSRLENKTVREISDLLQIPERTVEYHITQSLKTLRLHLKDYLPTLWFFFLVDF